MWVCACECGGPLRPGTSDFPGAELTGGRGHLLLGAGKLSQVFRESRGAPGCWVISPALSSQRSIIADVVFPWKLQFTFLIWGKKRKKIKNIVLVDFCL